MKSQTVLERPLARAAFADAPPSAPAWFSAAIAVEPERSTVGVGDATIELLTWGERGRPGLLLAPGLCAHADWWSFIAPMFLPHYRVAALSLSGMGGSSWRPVYRFEDNADELWACAKAAGLYDHQSPPTFIGHSQGGWAVFYSALKYPERMGRGILIDTAYNARGPADAPLEEPQHLAPVRESVYASREEALSRFRLYPDQEVENNFIVDFIADRSLKSTVREGREVWTWRFDPQIFVKISSVGFALNNRPAPLTHIIGERSVLMARTDHDQPPLLRRYMPVIRIPEAGHHVMIDQPLALVSTLRTLLMHGRMGRALN